MAEDFLRVCDICSSQWNMSQLRYIGDGQYACPWDSPGLHNADMRGAPRYQLVKSAKPRKNAAEPSVIDLFKMSEADVFNLIANWHGSGVAPYRYLDTTSGDGARLGDVSVRAAGWACVYLHGLIVEGKRPKSWVDRATEQLGTFGDWLLTQQNGSSTQSSTLTDIIGTSVSTDTDFGGFPTLDSAPEFNLAYIYSEDVAICGLALLRCYQVLGDQKYQTGYRAALTMLRRMQSGGKLTLRHATPTSGGTAVYNSGMFDHVITLYDGLGLGGGIDGGAVIALKGNAWGTATTTEAVSASSLAQMVDLGNLSGTLLKFRPCAYVSSLGGGATCTLNVYMGGTTSIGDGTLVATATASANGALVGAGSYITNPGDLEYIKLAAVTSSGTATITGDCVLIEVA